jgi:uncharacterized protein (TIGR03435 family)
MEFLRRRLLEARNGLLVRHRPGIRNDGMIPEYSARKLHGKRTTVLSLALGFAAFMAIFIGFIGANLVSAQSPASATPQAAPAPAQAATPAEAQGFEGTWQGTLHAGHDLRIATKITKADGGGYKAVYYSIDEGGLPLTIDKVGVDGSSITLTLNLIGVKYEGKLSGDGKTMAGTWTQGPNTLPLPLTRATPETEWSIPTPPSPVPPMAADANPNFEVATIKPSKPGAQGKAFFFRAGHFMTSNTDLNDLIAFAYGLHPKQIVDAPAWFGTDLFDIEAKPDREGRPSVKQERAMTQKLLEERFQLKFHHDKQELSVYVISVAGGGAKMTKSTSAATESPTGVYRELGDLTVRNQTMGDFATWMQSGVMDRPVVDQTGLTDRYDFQLKWTPDESQFAAFRGVGAVVPPPSDNATAPPALYTAITEQLGLKMAPGKVPVDVIVIDHIEKPSAN